MRRIVSVLAVVIGWGVIAQAQDVEFNVKGDFRARYQNNNNTTGLKANPESASGVEHRAKVGLHLRKGENVQGQLTLINALHWGSGTGSPDFPDSNSPNRYPPKNGVADASNLILVNRAWGWWKATDTLTMQLGRLGLEVGDGSVFSENDWEQVPVAHDGVLGQWDLDFARLDLIAIKTNDYGVTTASGIHPNAFDQERNLYGVSFEFKSLPVFINLANFHFMQINKDETGIITGNDYSGMKQNVQRLGFALGGDYFGFLYKASGAFASGKEKGRTATADKDLTVAQYMVDSLLGYRSSSAWAWKIWATYHSDSGDKDSGDAKDNQYDPLFYNRHDNAGRMDLLRWGNLTYWSGNISMSPAEDFEVGMAYYKYTRTVTGATSGVTYWGPGYDANGTSGLGALNTASDLGQELNLFASKQYDNGNFKLSGHIGAFLPGAAIKDSLVNTNKRDRPLYQYMVEGMMMF